MQEHDTLLDPPAPANGRVALASLEDGQQVDAIAVVRERERRSRRNGGDFLRLVLGDASGSVEAVCWDEVDERAPLAEPGSIVRVAGRFEVHPRFGPKITVDAIRPAPDDEYELADLCPTAPVSTERLESDLRELLATVRDPHLSRLLERFFGEQSEIWPRFRRAPAAKYFHQAYAHGLLEHSLSVAQAVSAASAFFPGIDRDVAVTGAILHDVGKLDAYNDDLLAIDLTDAGRLEGEITLGYYRVRSVIESIEDFPPALAQEVLHILLSHHGSLEHGSPVIPATREATLVHFMDNLGGKLGSFDRIERELPEGEAWSKFDRAIDGAAYFHRRVA